MTPMHTEQAYEKKYMQGFDPCPTAHISDRNRRHNQLSHQLVMPSLRQAPYNIQNNPNSRCIEQEGTDRPPTTSYLFLPKTTLPPEATFLQSNTTSYFTVHELTSYFFLPPNTTSYFFLPKTTLPPGATFLQSNTTSYFTLLKVTSYRPPQELTSYFFLPPNTTSYFPLPPYRPPITYRRHQLRRRSIPRRTIRKYSRQALILVIACTTLALAIPHIAALAPTAPTAHAWLRDLHEEGIEPHPGPTFYSQNIDSLLSRANPTLRRIAALHKYSPIAAVAIQEHQVPPDRAQRIVNTAHYHGLLMALNPLPRNAHKGGTALIIPYAAIEKKQGETDDDSRKRVRDSIYHSADGRITTLRTLINGQEITIASVYAPQDDNERITFLAALRNKLDSTTLLGIDANCVPDPSIDLKREGSVTPYPNKGAAELADTMTNLDITDIFRESFPDVQSFTKRTVTDYNNDGTPRRMCATRIDQIYTPAVDGLIFTHLPLASDLVHTGQWGHRTLRVKIESITEERGRDLETINESIFTCPKFNTRITVAINNILASRAPRAGEWSAAWEEIKIQIRAMCVAESMRVRTANKKDLQVLKHREAHINSQIQHAQASPQDYTRLDEIRKQIRQLTRPNTTLHSALEKDAYTTGQKHDVSTAAFYRQWTPRNAAQWVSQIMRADWTDPSNPKDQRSNETNAAKIAAAFTRYYQALFAPKKTSKVCKAAALRTLQKGNRVLPPTAVACGAPITEKEVLHESAYLPLRKSPGPDRIPNAFYKTFSAIIAPILTHVLNESHARGTLPATMTEGIISVLYKKKERDDPRNYRPITLLNCDYKIMMRILTARMNKAVVQFISKDQNGFVPGAFIAENLMRLKLIQDYIEDEDQEALFIFLDMEKAFDRCSWEFLTAGLEKIGFDDTFINYVKLAYSHDHPPTRMMYVNGYLGPKFHLGSGVAQGCPLSPLLFLIITEPLSRLINENSSISGVKMGGIRHKISQFADDSTLIARISDIPVFNAMLLIWERATAMRENNTKREAMLLGNLRHTPHRAPKGVVKDDRYLRDGDTIRALGVPVGTNFDLTAWWRKRYTDVKPRVANWFATSRLSLTGRNMLLQSILYGSFRYWFFTLLVPDEIIDAIESDAKNLLWATTPSLQTNEFGTAARSRRYMIEAASYLPQREGGGSIMQLRSHIAAFQAQWIIRYLDPRDTPWKNCLDHWIGDRFRLGRGALLASPGHNFHQRIPQRSTYIRECLRQFQNLALTQDTSLLTYASQGEPLHKNKRFPSHITPDARLEWTNRLETYRLSDLANEHDAIFTHSHWQTWIRQAGFAKGQQWISQRLSEIYTLLSSIPANVRHATTARPVAKEGDYVTISFPDSTIATARIDLTSGSVEYQEVFLDANSYPHPTGYTLDPPPAAKITPCAIWKAPNKNYQNPYSGDTSEEEEIVTAVGPPITQAYPLNEGWHLPDQPPRKPSADAHAYGDDLRRLTDLTIHELTLHFTKRTTDGVRPNCEHAWETRLAPPFPIPWKTVWASIGTPLSDPTEEKAWRKLLHRAINARNRHPTNPDKSCRLKCGCNDESMLHLIECMHARPLWSACAKFIQNTLGETTHRDLRMLIIFNLATPPAN